MSTLFLLRVTIKGKEPEIEEYYTARELDAAIDSWKSKSYGDTIKIEPFVRKTIIRKNE
jgi:hypothetical protein